MHVTVSTPPDSFLDLDEVKAHLRVETDDDDDLLTALIAAACAWLDGPAGWLARSIGVQTLELRDRAFACDRLPYGPVIDVERVAYLDGDGTEQEVAEDAFRLLSDGSIRPALGESWPSTYGDDEAVRITYSAGYAPEGEDSRPTVPAPLRTGATMVVGYLYQNREASPEDALKVGAVSALLSPFRLWSL